MHLAEGNKTLGSRQVEEGGSVDPLEWAGPWILQALVMRKAVGSGPRIRRRRPRLGAVGRAWRGPAGQKPRDAVGGGKLGFACRGGEGWGSTQRGEDRHPDHGPLLADGALAQRLSRQFLVEVTIGGSR